jgi:hypothetical protein
MNFLRTCGKIKHRRSVACRQQQFNCNFQRYTTVTPHLLHCTTHSRVTENTAPPAQGIMFLQFEPMRESRSAATGLGAEGSQHGTDCSVQGSWVSGAGHVTLLESDRTKLEIKNQAGVKSSVAEYTYQYTNALTSDIKPYRGLSTLTCYDLLN